MKTSEGVCSRCSTGCSIHVDQNKDIVYRLRPRPNPEAEANYTTSRPHQAFLVKETLPFWGRRSAAIAVARGELGLVDLGVEGVIQQLRHDVRVHYYGLLFALRAEEIGRLELQNDRELLELTRARFEHGDTPELEVKQARLSAGRAEATLGTLSSEVDIARGELNLDLGREREAPIVLAGRLEERPPLPDVERLVERALGEGREARELRQRVTVEESRLRLARTGWVPDLTAGAGALYHDGRRAPMNRRRFRAPAPRCPSPGPSARPSRRCRRRGPAARRPG